MRRVMVAVVVLAAVSVAMPAQAGLLSFLFGSKGKVAQYFDPAVTGALTARDRNSLNEMTFDLSEGREEGGKYVFDRGIPVERGLIMVGSAAASTADREVGQCFIRVDSRRIEKCDLVCPPKPGQDEEAWLEWAVMEARKRAGFRGTFAPFATTSAPFYFVIDTATLMCSSHCVEIFVRQSGKNGRGATCMLDFRVVEPEFEERIVSEDVIATGPACQGQPQPQGDFKVDTFQNSPPPAPRQVRCERLYQWARAKGYQGNPNQDGTWNSQTMSVVVCAVNTNGDLIGGAPVSVEIVVSGQVVKTCVSTDGDGVISLSTSMGLRGVERLNILYAGQKVRSTDVRAGLGQWIVVRPSGR